MNELYVDSKYYASAGPMTGLRLDPAAAAGLPATADGLCRVAQGLIVHQGWAGDYGVEDIDQRQEQMESRSAARMLAVLQRLDPQSVPLAQVRPANRRLVGNCRHLTVLTCALLRDGGVPARARVGFADYFGEGWTDHWVVERWDADRCRWQRSDPQLDDLQCLSLGVDFDPLDLPYARFLDASEAWRRCRRGEEDPDRFGIQDMRGLWFIAGNVVRDLAALQKVELLPWDVWGVMDTAIGEVEDQRTALVDEVADVVANGTRQDQQRLYARPELKVPDSVFSARLGRAVAVGGG